MSKQESIERLREWFPEGSTVYTILRHVSSSGMSRTIGIVCLSADGKGMAILHPNRAAADVLGWKVDPKRDGIRVRGCGKDMGLHLVYELSSLLYSDGYALKHQWL